MAAGRPLLIPLGGPGEWGEKVVGGKAAKLAQLSPGIRGYQGSVYLIGYQGYQGSV